MNSGAMGGRGVVGFTYRQTCRYSNPRYHILCSAPVEHFLAHGLALYGMMNHKSRPRRLTAFVVLGRCCDLECEINVI